ncbi:hypothetical protein J525_3764 [Acinetobacter sp. 21871]|uniref:Uncharacterized protein n=1 Tax=Acinetobacter baumannii (strain 1295743) TaxID=1310613 RepID=A0A009I0Z3_ACIB9|nr:hypothetical protein J512_3299 [Acinetobacter baumannii 1295743]EXB64790.1 hypothetical protein J525_3764 [Acinetobacter sp. 21871]
MESSFVFIAISPKFLKFKKYLMRLIIQYRAIFIKARQ